MRNKKFPSQVTILLDHLSEIPKAFRYFNLLKMFLDHNLQGAHSPSLFKAPTPLLNMPSLFKVLVSNQSSILIQHISLP